MKIEFKKVPNDLKELKTEFNSVKIEGTFCRISSSLVKIEAKLSGNIKVDCSRCAELETLTLNEELKLILSDGLFKGEEKDEFLVIEVENSLIDFDEIIESELNSIKSDYHICNNCLQKDELVEQEF
ncbi:hypothetical protein [Aliarcobacter lanthieri]|uniref:hypothetical protein n=1 Tax=Aliarcobacter lanthieri TaxID=1355374 RepID=UPI00047D3FBA|nr:hypothetical protein [Aliarcobacter lanthieri]QKF58477.1 hypothetical protein ALANTH_0345 [Aliarcobacter lanthieri]